MDSQHNSILNVDYFSADLVMASITALKDRMFHNEVAKPSKFIKKIEQPLPTHQQKEKIILMSREDLDRENVQVCIQNINKLIIYLTSIKAKKTVNSAIFTTSTEVIVMTKSQTSQPILVMKFPIDDVKVFARSPNLIIQLPLESFITKQSQSLNYENGFAFYVKKTIDESGATLYSLHYDTKTGSVRIPGLASQDSRFIETMLRPSSPPDGELRMRTINEHNLNKLERISLMLMIQISSIAEFKGISKDLHVSFEVEADDTGDVVLVSKSEANNGNQYVEKIIARKSANPLVWEFRVGDKFRMYNKTTLVLQSATTKIRANNKDFMYYGFGRYGEEFVFLKILASGLVNLKTDSGTGLIYLNESLKSIFHLFEMYFCYRIVEK